MSDPRNVSGNPIPTPQPHEVNGVVNPTVRHERSDVDTRGVLWFVAILAAGLVVALLGLRVMFVYFMHEETARKKSDYRLAEPQRGQLPLSEQLPPAPHLEGLSVQGLEQPIGRVFPPAADAQHVLSGNSGNSSIEQNEQIVEAMKQVADKLPARKGEQLRPRDDFASEPTSSSSGRMPRGGQP